VDADTANKKKRTRAHPRHNNIINSSRRGYAAADSAPVEAVGEKKAAERTHQRANGIERRILRHGLFDDRAR